MPIPASMEMKAMMFAGGGLFLSMVATTIWISGDVARMREEERAKHAEKCAIAAQTQSSQAQTATGTAPATDFTTQPAPEPVDDACASTNGGATDGQADPAAGGIDPVTGAPLGQGEDGFSTGDANIDPATGQPVDPAFDPGAQAGVDPSTGQPIASPDPAIDPLASQGASGGPESTVVEAGF